MEKTSKLAQIAIGCCLSQETLFYGIQIQYSMIYCLKRGNRATLNLVNAQYCFSSIFTVASRLVMLTTLVRMIGRSNAKQEK